MSNKKITSEQKERALEALKEFGTMPPAAKAAGVTRQTLNAEMRRSEVFKRRVLEAREEGRRKVSDESFEVIRQMALGEIKGDRNQLTAAIAINNAYEPGFRGTTTVQGKVEHEVRVITAVPRPKYQLTQPTINVIEGEVIKQLPEGRKPVPAVKRKGGKKVKGK